MKSLLLLFLNLLCGADMSLGIGCYTLTSAFFGVEFNIWTLGLAVFCSHLPDADMAPYLLLRKKIGPVGKHKAGGHWPYGHHPLLLLPAAMAIGILFAGATDNNSLYSATLAFFSVLAHFARDSAQPQGLHWFSPFSWNHYALRKVTPERVPDELVSAFYRNQKSGNASYELSSRIKTVGLGELIFFASNLALLGLAVFFQ